MSTVPMLGMILDATPLETQSIRKRFAKDWAVKEFFRVGANDPLERTAAGAPASVHGSYYTEAQLAPYIQMCLDPLPKATAKVKEVVQDTMESKLSKDEDGEIVTRAVKSKEELHVKK
jgi:hypothetical protein